MSIREMRNSDGHHGIFQNRDHEEVNSTNHSCKTQSFKISTVNIGTLPSILKFLVNLNVMFLGTGIHKHDTKFSCNLRPIQHRLKLIKYLPSQFGIKILNKLPITIEFEISL